MNAWQIAVCVGCLLVGGWIFVRTLRGRYSVGDQPCASWCIDAELEREREERLTYGEPSCYCDDDDDDDDDDQEHAR
jgi:hypothetical protein